jgi:hypothetical protein
LANRMLLDEQTREDETKRSMRGPLPSLSRVPRVKDEIQL